MLESEDIKPSFYKRKMGKEGSDVLIVDGFHPSPESIVEAAKHEFLIESAPTYPGIRGPAPAGYSNALVTTLADKVVEVFGGALRARPELCALSVVTKPPNSLSPLQKIPHFDGPDPSRLAFVHYLCAPDFGGTSFYRHTATGFESVTQDRQERYQAVVSQELASIEGKATSYPNDKTAYFERIGSVACRYNRLVLYRGSILHSGDIPNPRYLSSDVETGRLTMTGFLRVSEPAI